MSNLGFLFGLNEHEGKQSVSGQPQELIRSAAGRKVGPYRATVKKIDDLEKDERWKLTEERKGEKEKGKNGTKRKSLQEEEESSSDEEESSAEEEDVEAGGFGDDVMQ